MQLSPSKLNVMNNCRRCFWLENKEKIKRPRGIFPSLPGGLDRSIKTYYDSCRPNLPLELTGLRDQKLFSNQATLNKWRHWRSGLSCVIDGVKLIGALDDCLINNDDGKLSPLDYKSKGSEPKDSGVQYYQTQLDCYDLMLKENGYATTGIGVLIYYYPTETQSGKIYFKTKYFEIPCSSVAAVRKIVEAKKILEGKIPEASNDCEYCEYERQKRAFLG